MTASPQKRLSIYLNDHLALSVAGLELAKRAARGNEGNDYGRFLAQLTVEIEQDRQTLRTLMGQLGVREARAKQVAGWLAEKTGRLKLNGQLRGYSPLSRLVELEQLLVGIQGKLALWNSLRATLPEGQASVDLAALADRAQRQRDAVEELRLRAAAEALG